MKVTIHTKIPKRKMNNWRVKLTLNVPYIARSIQGMRSIKKKVITGNWCILFFLYSSFCAQRNQMGKKWPNCTQTDWNKNPRGGVLTFIWDKFLNKSKSLKPTKTAQSEPNKRCIFNQQSFNKDIMEISEKP